MGQCSIQQTFPVAMLLCLRRSLAPDPPQHPARQEEAAPVTKSEQLETLGQVCDPARGLPTVHQRPEQAPAVCRDQWDRLLEDPQKVGQDLEIRYEGALLISSRRGTTLLQCHRHQRAVGPGHGQPSGAWRLGGWRPGHIRLEPGSGGAAPGRVGGQRCRHSDA